MFNKVKKIFKLSNWKRWAISSVSLVTMVLAISIGSVYSLNNKPSIDYKSGAEIVLQVTNPDDDINVIKRQTEQRLKLTLSPSSEYEVTLNSDNFFRITGTNIETDEELKKFKDFVAPEIIQKPTVTYLDSEVINNIIFYDSTMSGDSISLNILNPIKLNRPGENAILIWNDLEGLKRLASNEFNDEWTAVNRDPYKFLFINGITEDVEGGQKAILKTKSFGGFDAIDFLISKNTVTEEGLTDSISLDFSFAPKITLTQKEKIFYNLDFSVSTYNFVPRAFNFIKPNLGSNAYEFLIIAAVVAFSFISVYLIVNYGLLGALSTICAAFLVFLGLLMISIFRGDYTPESIAALLLAIGIGLDLNIAFFERMKKELKSGNSLQKSLKKADKLTMKSTLTKAIALIITSVVIYVLGSLYLGTFSSLVLIISILSVLILFILIRVLTTLIIGTKAFDNNLKWIGIYKNNKTINQNEIEILNDDSKTKTTNDLINEESLISNANDVVTNGNSKKVTLAKRISLLILAAITIVGVTMFTTFSTLGAGWLSGFKADGKITNPTVFRTTDTIKEKDLSEIKNIFKKEFGISDNEIKTLLVDKNSKSYSLEISTKKQIEIGSLLDKYNVGLISYSIIAGNANNAILNIIYITLTTILAMAIFVLFKSDWSYALTMLISLIAAFLIFILLFTFQLFTFNTFFIFTLASAILIGVSNNITILFRIKEKMKNKKMEELTKVDIKKISDVAVKDSLRRLLISNGIIMITLLIFTCLPGSLSISFTIPLMIFILVSLIVSTVIVPFLFTIFKTFRCKRRRNKILNNYWHTQAIEEQTFPSINDIK